MTNVSFQIEGLYFSYGKEPIFKNISAASTERIIVLQGPSGCGKTTLLKILYGLLKPQSCIYISQSPNACLVLQEDGLFPWLSGMDNILLTKTISRESIERHPLFFLIESFVHKNVYELSFGQRRKIELLRALSGDFNALYLDEPFNFIDPESRVVLATFLNNECPAHIVMTSHYSVDITAITCDIFVFDGKFPVAQITVTHHANQGVST